MAKSRSPEAVQKLLDISRTGGINIGSAEDRAEDVGGIIHAEHIQLYVSIQTFPAPLLWCFPAPLHVPPRYAALLFWMNFGHLQQCLSSAPLYSVPRKLP